LIQVQLTRGFAALIDDADESLVAPFSWQAGGSDANKSPYATYVRHTPTGVVHIAMHRLIMGAGPGQLVDHRDGDGLNNTRSNLRICTSLENARNKSAYARRKRAAGGFLGVLFNKRARLWVATIHAGPPNRNGEAKKITLRCHTTAEEAARAYDSAAGYYFGEFAGLNFPEESPAPFDPSAFGFRRRGADVVNAKLTEEAVRDIRASSEPLRVVARRYGITISVASVVRRREAWKHVA
jgi:hypothetical protein